MQRRHIANRIASAFTNALGGDGAAGVILIVAALAAVLAANSPFAHAYHAIFHDPLAASPIAPLSTLHLWINDGLMAVFFFTVVSLLPETRSMPAFFTPSTSLLATVVPDESVTLMPSQPFLTVL